MKTLRELTAIQQAEFKAGMVASLEANAARHDVTCLHICFGCDEGGDFVYASDVEREDAIRLIRFVADKMAKHAGGPS